MSVQKSLYISESYDPFHNVGLEEYLIDTCDENEVILYLWQNSQTIFIGKHQNPYKECNITRMQNDGINLVRRKSGGGAVFHDTENLNFTFIARRKNYDQNRHFAVILDALKDWGIQAEQTGRNDISVDGKKFSGNAFIFKKDVQCHHGTLLLNVNMGALGNYLTPPAIKLVSKGVDSVRSRVVNLIDLNPKLSIDGLKDSLARSFDKLYSGPMERKTTPSSEVFEKISESFKHWDWVMAKSPKADLGFSMKFTWGNIVMDISVDKGRVQSAIISTDTLQDQPFEQFAAEISGEPFEASRLTEIVDTMFTDDQICQDMKTFIGEFIHNAER